MRINNAQNHIENKNISTEETINGNDMEEIQPNEENTLTNNNQITTESKLLENEEMYEEPNDLENELESEENAVQSLIIQMNVDDIMASNYIKIDARIEIAEMVDEEKIIAAVPEEEKEAPNNPISNIVTLDSINKILILSKWLGNLRIERPATSIRRKQNTFIKQLTLESFCDK
nr:11562_t:CDS:2 [Entrophospora candida]